MPESSSRSDQAVPLREICDRHDGEWLLVQILDAAAPAGDEPSVLLAHAADWGAVFKANRKARKQDSTAVLEILQGGTKFGDGDALHKALSHVKSQDEWVSVNRW